LRRSASGRTTTGDLFLLFLLSAEAVPNKPLWAEEFDAPFGLTNIKTPIPVVNSSSYFYYQWTDLQATRIDYYDHCIPILDDGVNYPCTLIFNPNGTYLSQPALGASCCFLFPGVGSVPPDFLKAFVYDSEQPAPDYYGNYHDSYYWTAPGFAYWTDQNTGADIFFSDGGINFWAWGDLRFERQDATLFDLPGTDEECSKLCTGVDPRHGLHIPDPYFNLAKAHSRIQQGSNSPVKSTS